jgi:MFS family permease
LLDGTLAVLTLRGNISIEWIFALTFFSGTVKGFDLTIRSAFINNLVKTEQLVNAISLNSSMFNVAKIVGPGIAGLLVIRHGEGLCFLVNSFSYLVVVLAISLMKNKGFEPPLVKIKIGKSMREGFAYTFKTPHLRLVVMFIACVGLFGFPYAVVLPVFVKDVLLGNADTLGFLTTFGGAGALTAALFMASRKKVGSLDKYMFFAGSVYCLGLFFLAFSSGFAAAGIILVIIGFGQVMGFASANSKLQTESDQDKVGRVLSCYITLFMGATMFGSLITGKMVDVWGTRYTLVYQSVMMFVCLVFFSSKLLKFKKVAIMKFVKPDLVSSNTIGQK